MQSALGGRGDAPERPPDYAKLAAFLDALAHPGRLELLHLLRHPRAVGDLQLRPGGGPMRPERAITRQAVRKHLTKLLDAQLVLPLGPKDDGRSEAYVVNHTMVFAVVEELRRVTKLTPSVALPAAATMTGPQGPRARTAPGARLIVVHGVQEGQTYPLDPRGGGRWVIGRNRTNAVPVDHDPFVSQEHALVTADGDGFLVTDLPGNKNGTSVNWQPLERGRSERLATGDVVGVGRTLLLFRAG